MKVKNMSKAALRIIPEFSKAFGIVKAPVPTIKLNIYMKPTFINSLLIESINR